MLSWDHTEGVVDSCAAGKSAASPAGHPRRVHGLGKIAPKLTCRLPACERISVGRLHPPGHGPATVACAMHSTRA